MASKMPTRGDVLILQILLHGGTWVPAASWRGQLRAMNGRLVIDVNPRTLSRLLPGNVFTSKGLSTVQRITFGKLFLESEAVIFDVPQIGTGGSLDGQGLFP